MATLREDAGKKCSGSNDSYKIWLGSPKTTTSPLVGRRITVPETVMRSLGVRTSSAMGACLRG